MKKYFTRILLAIMLIALFAASLKVTHDKGFREGRAHVIHNMELHPHVSSNGDPIIMVEYNGSIWVHDFWVDPNPIIKVLE